MLAGQYIATAPDFQLFFESGPHPYLVAQTDSQWTIVAVSNSYLEAMGMQRDGLLGRGLLDIFQGDADILRMSLESAQRHRVQDIMPVQQHRVAQSDTGGNPRQRYHRPVNTPIVDADGSIDFIVHQIEDISNFVAAQDQIARQNAKIIEQAQAHAQRLEAELHTAHQQLRIAMESLEEYSAEQRAAESARMQERLQDLDVARTDLFSNVFNQLGALTTCARYLAAGIIFALALFTRLLILPLDAGLAFLTFYPAIAITVFLCGLGPGLLAVLVSAASAQYMFMPPFWSFKFSDGALASLGVFTISGIIICLIVDHMLRGMAKVNDVNRRLKSTMQALTQDVTERKLAESVIRDNEKRYRSLFENMLEGFAYCKILYENQQPQDFVYIEVNSAFEKLTGLKNVCGKRVSEVIPGIRDANPELFALYARVAASGNPERLETYVEALDIWFSLSAYSTEKDYFIAVFDNITERKKIEAELNLAASVFHNTMEGVVVTDMNACIITVNPAFSEITGYSAAEAIGNRPSMVRSDHHGPDFYNDLWNHLLNDGFWQGEIWNRRKGGEVYLEWLTISSVAGTDGKPVRYLGVFSDITELRRKDEHIRHLAFHDPLTDLPNRSLLLNRLEHGIACAERDQTRLGVMFIDLDRFKAINDSLGHDIGDSLLREVANRLKLTLRASDTIARMGGDEFVILLEHAEGLESYAMLAEKIITALAQPIVLGVHTMQINTSIGIACFPDDGSNAIEMMQHADAAMYAAKSAGRGTYRFFQAAMTEKAMQHLKLEMELRNAIPNHELELFYQPQVTLATNQPCGMEALVRWRHPVFGLIPPSDFIPLAEETGIINALGDWVLEEACRQSSRWQQQGVGRFRIAVNISAKQLQKGDLVERILDLTEQNGILPSDLEIELTESVVMANPEEIARVFARLREIGVSVAVDDFGTGYSSLAYLRRLPIDVLKIDRSFVMNVDRDEEDAQIVRTVIALAQTLKLAVVAEGVETRSQADFLQSCSCTTGQGYFYARPAPATQIEAWLLQHASAAANT